MGFGWVILAYAAPAGTRRLVLRYFDLLQKFKKQDLDFFCFAKLSEEDQIGFATELLVLARFEPRLINCALSTVQDVVPVLPQNVRFDLVRAMCALVEDFHLYEGKSSYAFLHPMLLLALRPSERLLLAEHFVAHLKPNHVSKASAALGALTRLSVDLAPKERKAVFAEILNFAKTRTLPDQDMQAILFELFLTNRADGFGMILSCLATMLLDQKDPAYLLLQVGFFQKIFTELEPLQKKHLLKDLQFLVTHSYRTVVNATLRFYQNALVQLQPADRTEILQLLLTLPDGAAYHDELGEIFKTYQADLPPLQRYPAAGFLPDANLIKEVRAPAQLPLRLVRSEE